MYNFDIADKIVKKILSNEWNAETTIPPYRELNPTVSEFLLKEKLSERKLNHLKEKFTDVEFAKMVGDENQNRWKYRKNRPEINELFKYLEDTDKKRYKPSGLFFTPPGGYCGWHTNSDNPGHRMYLVWAEEDNKSFFKWKDPNTGEIITKWEKKGWNVNKFEAPMWHCLGSWTNRISIGVASHISRKNFGLRGTHSCKLDSVYGDWRINELDAQQIDLQHIRYLLTSDKIETINHKEICWKGMDNPEAEQRGIRYERCDISYPCIVLKDAINPKNMKYRMIDGKHRMSKMKSENINTSKFYVLSYDDIKNYIKPIGWKV